MVFPSRAEIEDLNEADFEIHITTIYITIYNNIYYDP